MNKKVRSMLALVLCFVMVAALAVGCVETPVDSNPSDPSNPGSTGKNPVTYNTTTTVMPSNWNEFTYADNNDTQIMGYIGSSFFSYDYKFEGDKKFNDDGSINKDGIIDGAYTTYYSAATKLEDVTSSVDAKWGYTDEQKTQGGYAWKITLRDDLKWDDGTAITAADFEYSMKALLDPLFLNFRANTYYDTLRMINARGYFYQHQAVLYNNVASFGYKTNQEAIDAGEVIHVAMWDFWGAQGAPKISSFDETTFVPVLDFENPCPEWVAYNDNTYYFDYAYFVSECGDYVKEDGSIDFDAVVAFNASLSDSEEDQAKYIDLSSFYFSAEMIYGAYGNTYFQVGQSYAAYVGIGRENEVRHVEWSDVGCYAIPEENAIVVCLEKSFSLLTEDGELAVWAPYYLSSLPLVHQTKYEASKIAPSNGATLWTSNYNSSLETTASWGPYKLAEFEAGSHYKLVKNENWYGWNMDTYKGQYQIDNVYCRKVEEFATQWMGFLKGDYDDSSLQTENYSDYQDSKYVYYTSTSTGTFGMQLFSDLSVLKDSGNNNGILAIKEFRQAFNLALNRSDVIENIWPGTAVPCFGLLSTGYYYDIENSAELADKGIYRETTIAQAGILRAYGFVEENGKWSSGDLQNLTLEEAYSSLTGYNPTLAKQKMVEAINILLADAEYYGYDASKNITLVYGASADTDKQRFRASYIQSLLDDLTKGTALEDKIDVKFDASAGSKWADAFRSGATQIGFGYGFSGNPFNPFDIVGAFVNPDDDLNYHMYWDTSAIDMTLTMPAGDYAGAGETITMSALNWFFCLNGLAEIENQPQIYNWDAGKAPAEARLTILSALEELVIGESRSVMLIADGGGSLLGAKFSYISSSENTFMGFGGIQYMEVNYDDVAWAEYVKANSGNLETEYKKSE